MAVEQADKCRRRLAIVDGLISVLERRSELIATHALGIPVGRMTELGRGDMGAEAVELRELLGDG